jgi:hypothetical protein
MLENASSPPADAPTPTMVTSSLVRLCASSGWTIGGLDGSAFDRRREPDGPRGGIRRTRLRAAGDGLDFFDRVFDFFAIRSGQCYRCRGRLRRAGNSIIATSAADVRSPDPARRFGRRLVRPS